MYLHGISSMHYISATYNLQQTTISIFPLFFAGRRFSCNIIPYFCRKFGKMSQNLSSAAVVIGAFFKRVNPGNSHELAENSLGFLKHQFKQ